MEARFCERRLGGVTTGPRVEGFSLSTGTAVRVALLMTPTSQTLGPPVNPGRFSRPPKAEVLLGRPGPGGRVFRAFPYGQMTPEAQFGSRRIRDASVIRHPMGPRALRPG